MVKKLLLYFSILTIFSVFVWFIFSKISHEREIVSQNKDFINPIIVAGVQKHFIINFQPLRAKFVEIQKKYPFKTYIYFLYLNNAAWVGVNEREYFTAASLVKVPLAMEVYKAIEDGRLKKDDVYTLEEVNLNSEFGELYKLGENTLTVEGLVEIMLTYSDNTAANALYTIMTRIGINDPLEKVYAYMGWDVKDIKEAPSYGLIHVKILSNMFLALYNSVYLKPEHSNLILKNLSNTSFNEEIVSGIPKSIKVSHKVGIYDNDKTLSDCGIVYAPQRDYVLCMASVGAEKDLMDNFMREISKASYDYVINN